MRDLLKLARECNADCLEARVERGIVTITIASRMRYKSQKISVEEIRQAIIPPYELLKEMFRELIKKKESR